MRSDQARTGGKVQIIRHTAGFIASGVIALIVDLGITLVLVRALGVSPFLARPPAIGIAIVVAWLCHRRLTFAVKTPPTLAEFVKYAAVASSASVINYAIYAAVLVALPALAPEAALVAASVGSLGISYVGMRFGVFAKPNYS
jgi:putative flippase GtrA